ncbi:MAG: hypothetical protein J5854_04660 [Clostridia bacterium]|nr:hypothetical protein [Clostridia bacterium]
MKTKLMRLFAAITVFASIMPLSACLDPVPLDECGFVITIGIDRGREKRFYYTFALQRPLSEQNTDAEGGAIALAAEGDGIFEAINEMEGNVPYSLDFSRTNFLIFSRETAEAGGAEELISTSFDALKIRTSAVMIVSEGSASEFIGGMYSNNDANISKLLSALMLDEKKTGMVTVMSVSRLLEACSDGRFDYCAAYGVYDDGIITDTGQKKSESDGKNPLAEVEIGDRAGGLKSMIVGAAVFSGFRMTGTLTRYETMLLNMVTGAFKTGVVTFPYKDTGGTVSVLLSLEKSRLAVGNDLSGSARITLTAAVHGKDADVPDSEIDAWLTGELPGILAEDMLNVFMKCRGADSDAMRFGTEAVKLFSTAAGWNAFLWKERYRDFLPAFYVAVKNADKYIGEDMQ